MPTYSCNLWLILKVWRNNLTQQSLIFFIRISILETFFTYSRAFKLRYSGKYIFVINIFNSCLIQKSNLTLNVTPSCITINFPVSFNWKSISTISSALVDIMPCIFPFSFCFSFNRWRDSINVALFWTEILYCDY